MGKVGRVAAATLVVGIAARLYGEFGPAPSHSAPDDVPPSAASPSPTGAAVLNLLDELVTAEAGALVAALNGC